jgi:uncharacterized protein (UPF0335 family)
MADGYKVKALNVEELKDLIIKVVRMSDKKDQIIDEIKNIPRKIGNEGFV